MTQAEFEEKYVNKIVCSDCLEVMKNWPDNCVDLVLTDPPYKVSQKYGGGVDADNLANVAGILRTFPEISRVLKPERFFVSFYDNRILPFIFEAVRGTILTYRKQIYLYRRWGNAHRWLGWMQTTDPVCIFVNGYDKPFTPADILGQVKHDCYVKDSPEDFNSGHPAQKPIEILNDVVTWCSNANDIILDPYCGSGGSLEAAKNLGRRYIGIDISPDYCKIAEERLRAVDTGVPVKEARAGQTGLFEI